MDVLPFNAVHVDLRADDERRRAGEPRGVSRVPVGGRARAHGAIRVRSRSARLPARRAPWSAPRCRVRVDSAGAVAVHRQRARTAGDSRSAGRLPDLRFNISHTDGLIACAVTIGREVGVDVEHINRHLTHDVADRFFAPREVADLQSLPDEEQQRVFFDYWTLKEAYIKARGFGLALPLGDFAFTLQSAESAGDHVRAVARRRSGDVAVSRRAGRPRGIAWRLAVRRGRAAICRSAFAKSCPPVTSDASCGRLAICTSATRRIGARCEALPAFPDDWLIIAGDTGEIAGAPGLRAAHAAAALRAAGLDAGQSRPLDAAAPCAPEQRGVAHYERLVALCRSYGVLTPEDPYAKWPGDGPTARDRADVPAVRLFVSRRRA